MADTLNESSSNSDADSDARTYPSPSSRKVRIGIVRPPDARGSGGAGHARNERRSLSRSQSLEKGAPADAAANALGGLELFEVPLGE